LIDVDLKLGDLMLKIDFYKDFYQMVKHYIIDGFFSQKKLKIVNGVNVLLLVDSEEFGVAKFEGDILSLLKNMYTQVKMLAQGK
jgi:hypothetical protein